MQNVLIGITLSTIAQGHLHKSHAILVSKRRSIATILRKLWLKQCRGQLTGFLLLLQQQQQKRCY